VLRWRRRPGAEPGGDPPLWGWRGVSTLILKVDWPADAKQPSALVADLPQTTDYSAKHPNHALSRRCLRIIQWFAAFVSGQGPDNPLVRVQGGRQGLRRLPPGDVGPLCWQAALDHVVAGMGAQRLLDLTAR
jgi:hypothetical protein